MSPEVEALLETLRGRLVTFVLNPTDHPYFWLAVFVAAAFLMIAARKKR